jgi:2-keto-3-deoxy-L-fuconate dehydrogenase
MTGRLAGKSAVVTSAAQGIGRATVLAMVAEGATVVATDINAAALDALAKENAAITTMILDVTRQGDVDAVAAKIPTPDILFNCSGYVHAGTIMDVVDKDWDFAFELNVRAHYRMMRAFTPGWLTKGKASVVNMASLASSVKGVPNRFLYGTSKAAVIGMTKAMAADYLAKGIRVNAPALSIRPRCMTACGPREIMKPRTRLSSPVNLWAAWVLLKKLRHWWFIWPVMRVPSSRDKPLTLMGDGRFRSAPYFKRPVCLSHAAINSVAASGVKVAVSMRNSGFSGAS